MEDSRALVTSYYFTAFTKPAVFALVIKLHAAHTEPVAPGGFMGPAGFDFIDFFFFFSFAFSSHFNSYLQGKGKKATILF